MPEISALAYMVINASDLDGWASFATGILGLQVGSRDDDLIALRMDERKQRILIERGIDDDLSALGWEFDTLPELNAYVARLRECGVEVTEVTDTVRGRGMEKVYSCPDSIGFRHEFCYGPELAPLSQSFHSPLLVGGGFETGVLGVGHVFTVAKNAAESARFYTEILGLRISDYIRDSEAIPGMTVDGVFMHTRTGRHHSLATSEIPSRKMLNHMMIQVKSLDDVGLAFDRVRAAGVPVILDIGHHPNDKMVSFYIVTPSGFGLEYGWGGVIIDENNWQVRTFSQLSDWGHRFCLQPEPVAV